MEIEILRNLLVAATTKIQSDAARIWTKLSLATNSIFAADVSRPWMRGYPFNNSTQYFTRWINNAFDHGCCRCCCLCPGPASVRSDEPGRNGRRGEDLHIRCSQVFLQDDAAAASLLVRLSASDWHPHTFITNTSQDKPELWDKPHSSASLSHLFAQLHAYRCGGPHFYGNPGL